MSGVVVIIPARYASKRFPGKLLALLAGRPLLTHVIERAGAARGVERLIVATDDERIAVVAEGSSEADAVRLAGEYRPDVLLFSLSNGNGKSQAAPHSLPACDTIKHLAQAYSISVLVVSRHDHKGLVRALLDAGASGFLRRDEALASSDELVKIILTLATRGRLTLSRAVYEKLQPYGIEIRDVTRLTERKIEIMQTIADNPQLTTPQVADLLGIAESTLRNNLSTIFRALDMPGLNGAMIECLRLGLVQISH